MIAARCDGFQKYPTQADSDTHQPLQNLIKIRQDRQNATCSRAVGVLTTWTRSPGSVKRETLPPAYFKTYLAASR